MINDLNGSFGSRYFLSDQERNSPYNINTITNIDIKHEMRIKISIKGLLVALIPNSLN